MFKIEVLYKEVANLYGDNGNIRYLESAICDPRIIYTSFDDTPKFLSEKIDLVYLGPTTENGQEEILKKLLAYNKQIKEKIEGGCHFLVIGNSLEIFGKYIKKLDGTKLEALGIFDVYARRIERLRHNDLIMGETKEFIKIVGFKNQMSHLYGEDKNYFLNLSFGCGRNQEETNEGIRYKGFIGTYVIGPILPLNPKFAEYLIKLIGGKISSNSNIIQEEATKAYIKRVEEYEKLMLQRDAYAEKK